MRFPVFIYLFFEMVSYNNNISCINYLNENNFFYPNWKHKKINRNILILHHSSWLRLGSLLSIGSLCSPPVWMTWRLMTAGVKLWGLHEYSPLSLSLTRGIARLLEKLVKMVDMLWLEGRLMLVFTLCDSPEYLLLSKSMSPWVHVTDMGGITNWDTTQKRCAGLPEWT